MTRNTGWTRAILIFARSQRIENMSKNGADTPLMQQHKAIKQKYPDAMLLFRVGDFYETFGEDAVSASRCLGHYTHKTK